MSKKCYGDLRWCSCTSISSIWICLPVCLSHPFCTPPLGVFWGAAHKSARPEPAFAAVRARNGEEEEEERRDRPSKVLWGTSANCSKVVFLRLSGLTVTKGEKAKCWFCWEPEGAQTGRCARLASCWWWKGSPACQTECDRNQVSVTSGIIRDDNPFINVNSSEKLNLWPCLRCHWRLPSISLSVETVEDSSPKLPTHSF